MKAGRVLNQTFQHNCGNWNSFNPTFEERQERCNNTTLARCCILSCWHSCRLGSTGRRVVLRLVPMVISVSSTSATVHVDLRLSRFFHLARAVPPPGVLADLSAPSAQSELTISMGLVTSAISKSVCAKQLFVTTSGPFHETISAFVP